MIVQNKVFLCLDDYMNRLNIGIIKPNQVTFNEWVLEDFKSTKFDEEIRKYIEVKTINYITREELLYAISSELEQFQGNKVGHTQKCYSSTKYLTYIMFSTSQEENRSCNTLGRYFTQDHEPLFGNSVILNTKKIDGKYTNVDITMKKIIKILRNKFIKTSILITPSCTRIEQCQELTYVNHPMDGSNLVNARCVVSELFNKNLIIFMEKEPEDDRMNPIATIIGKNRRIHGRVVLTMTDRDAYRNTNSISLELFKKMMYILCDHSISRILDIDENDNTNFEELLDKLKKTEEINLTIPDDIMNSATYNASL